MQQGERSESGPTAGVDSPDTRAAVAGIVLAGGRSRRMGRDKSSLDWDGEPMLARVVRIAGTRCDPVLVVARTNSAAYRALQGTGGPPAEWVTDEATDVGALGGLVAGLRDAARRGADRAFVCATDMPLITGDLIDELLAALGDNDAAVAVDAQRVHPLAAVYRTRVAESLAELTVTGERRLLAGLDTLTVNRVPVSDADWLVNVNAPEDVHRLRTQGVGAAGV
nr:molybdenum cofactor guanylyltransferase [Williamsia sterculiae]